MKKIFLYLVVLIASQLVYAWPGGSAPSGSSGGPGMNQNDGTSTSNNRDLVPVDGGIITVTALAIGYGVRQARKKKEDSNTDNGAV